MECLLRMKDTQEVDFPPWVSFILTENNFDAIFRFPLYFVFRYCTVHSKIHFAMFESEQASKHLIVACYDLDEMEA